MAGDWTPFRHDLIDDPAVLRMSSALSIPRQHVIGCLYCVWTWFDRHTVDGNAVGVTEIEIDALAAHGTFARAMQSVSWLVINSDGCSIPNFDRWMSKGAKKRVNTAKRVETHRKRNCNASVTPAALPEKRREEKRREESAAPLPPSENEDGGRAAEEASAAITLLRGAGVSERGIAKAMAVVPPPGAVFIREWIAELQRRRVESVGGMLVTAIVERWQVPEKPPDENPGLRAIMAAANARNDLWERAKGGDVEAMKEYRETMGRPK